MNEKTNRNLYANDILNTKERRKKAERARERRGMETMMMTTTATTTLTIQNRNHQTTATDTLLHSVNEWIVCHNHQNN